MTRNKRACLLRKLKPLNWYYFCQMEALNFGKASPVTKQEQLMLSEASLNKYLEVWRSHRMIRRERGGYIVVQFDGVVSGISADPIQLNGFSRTPGRSLPIGVIYMRSTVECPMLLPILSMYEMENIIYQIPEK
ncbi:MAG: hypothetical protein P4L49_00990 [Desulfosporosinus sp.]|nr:hypothetical protein [Desulfosporosinus sp.]